ncbi:MAG: hypothetical protein BWX49_00309 [Bacteroidetes bacterium ADurb.Bin008]|mgnify:CR=1|jgi:hypothetical protein|nr:MAG: hypothetical protein BWX49_00309 [Bacteroidetes bacterium ADurb.Bin008]
MVVFAFFYIYIRIRKKGLSLMAVIVINSTKSGGKCDEIIDKN